MKVINTFILLCYNRIGDSMSSKKIGYIISISVIVITLVIGIMIIKSNNKLIYTKKDLIEVNNINTRNSEILKSLKDLKVRQKKEYKKNGRSKYYLEISNKIDKLNAEKSNLDMELDALDRNKYINYKGMIPGILLIIFGIVIGSLVFVKSKNMKDNQLT